MKDSLTSEEVVQVLTAATWVYHFCSSCNSSRTLLHAKFLNVPGYIFTFVQTSDWNIIFGLLIFCITEVAEVNFLKKMAF